MVKLLVSGSLLFCGQLMLCFLASCSGGNGNTAQEVGQVYSDTVNSDQLQNVVSTLRSKMPIANEDGEFQSVTQGEEQVVIDYVMAEERFMSYYSMSEEERNDEKHSFCELLEVTPFKSLLYQCNEENVSIRLNVIGITSKEKFFIDFKVEE